MIQTWDEFWVRNVGETWEEYVIMSPSDYESERMSAYRVYDYEKSRNLCWFARSDSEDVAIGIKSTKKSFVCEKDLK